MVGSITTYYLHDQGEPIIELNSSGTVTAFNIFAPDGLVARTAGSTTTEYVFDQQGNVADRTNTSGAVQSVTQYDGWGNEQAISGTPTDPFGYNAQSGYYLDRETGLYLCQHRFYDPANGVWLNRDPIGYGGGTNLYGYCAGGPVGWADRSGLQVSALEEFEEFEALEEWEAEGGAVEAVDPVADAEGEYERDRNDPEKGPQIARIWPPRSIPDVPENDPLGRPATPGRDQNRYPDGTVCEAHPYQGRRGQFPGEPIEEGEPGYPWGEPDWDNHYYRHMHPPGTHDHGIPLLPVPYSEGNPWPQGMPGQNVGKPGGSSRIV